MQTLSAADLMSLEHYARERASFRARLIEYRRTRLLKLGEHCTWSFEDRLTVQYQVQEMLRAERIFESEGIDDELGAYNPLIPSGANLKATMLIEYVDAAERARRLIEMRGIERACWLQVSGFERSIGIADEDLPRENDSKTSAVHFLRFEFSAAMIGALKSGQALLAAGIDHPAYECRLEPIPAPLQRALIADFD